MRLEAADSAQPADEAADSAAGEAADSADEQLGTWVA